MPYLLVRHKVKNYAAWKPLFDKDHSAIKARGSTGGRLYRNAENRNEVIVIFNWDNLDKARQFAQSENLNQAMKQAGVIDGPDFYFLEEIEEFKV